MKAGTTVLRLDILGLFLVLYSFFVSSVASFSLRLFVCCLRDKSMCSAAQVRHMTISKFIISHVYIRPWVNVFWLKNENSDILRSMKSLQENIPCAARNEELITNRKEPYPQQKSTISNNPVFRILKKAEFCSTMKVDCPASLSSDFQSR